MTAIFFLTYRTENKLGHYMAEFEYLKTDDLQKEFYQWVSDSKKAIESKYECDLTITSINLIK